MSQRWVSYLFCLLGLPLYLWGMQGERRTGALPADFAVHGLSFPVRLDGVTAQSPSHLRSLVEGYAPGRAIRIDDAAGGTRLVSVVPAFPTPHRRISWISAWFFWLVAFLVFAGQPERDPGRVFFLATFTYGLAIAVGTVAFPAGSSGLDALRPVVRTVCMALLPVFFVQMSLRFPRKRPVIDARPWLVPSLYAAALVLAAWHSVVLLRYFGTPSSAHWSASMATGRTLDLFLATLVGLGGVLMYQNGRRADLEREKKQLKWLWWGIIVGTSPYVFLHALPKALGWRELIPLHVTRVFAMAAPVSFAFAAVRYRLLDIDVIIRRSLIYGVLAGIIATVYLFLAELVGTRIASLIPGSRPYVPIIAAVISVMLFGPTRRAVGAWVDHTFFHIRHSYGQALRRFRAAIARSRGQKELAQFLRRFAIRMFAPKSLSVIVRVGSDWFAVGNVDEALARWAISLFEQAPKLKERLMAAPNSTSTPEVERGEMPRELLEAGILLVQPLAAYSGLQGLVLLGEKRSERRYIEEDLALLNGVAAAGSVTLERLNLAQRVAEERIGRERLDEINRMKSDFLSRVAHDLRTPVTSIDWSARNLLDGLAGPLRPEQASYLQAILASSIHLRRLVTNLLEISRFEQAESRIELGPVCVASVAREAVVSLAPIAGAKHVKVTERTGEDLGPVRGHRDKLLQVIVNLLDNAIRYAPPGSVVEIALEPSHDGIQRLLVRDCGPGIPPGEEEAIFERFRQAAPSPHAPSQGFGLGLYVVRAHVEAFSGTVRAGNHSRGGAEFEVLLQDWEPGGVAIV